MNVQATEAGQTPAESLGEQLTKCFKKVVKSKELISRLFSQQRKYLLKKVRAEKPALLKVSLIRNYESLNLKKHIIDIVLFRAAPFDQESGEESSLNTSLKSSIFRDIESVQFGATV